MDITSTSEIWKEIPDFPSIYFSSLGNCKKVYSYKETMLKKDTSRYRVYKNGKTYTLHIQTLLDKLFPDSLYQFNEPTKFLDLEGEEWRNIVKFQYLQVSNIGRVRRLDSHVDFNGFKRYEKGGIYAFSLNKKGYPVFGFSTNGKPRVHLIHRLVAEAFIPNPDNKPHINHKDGVKTNNKVENLEWCTISENNLHAYATGLNTGRRGIKVKTQ